MNLDDLPGAYEYELKPWVKTMLRWLLLAGLIVALLLAREVFA